MKKLKLFFFIVLSIFAFIIINKLTYCFINYPLDNFFIENVNVNFSRDLSIIYLRRTEVFYGIIGMASVFLFYIYKKYDRTNYKEKKEHGSATWGNPKDISQLIDKIEQNNILFTDTEKISLNTRKTMKNNNVLVIGGSR